MNEACCREAETRRVPGQKSPPSLPRQNTQSRDFPTCRSAAAARRTKLLLCDITSIHTTIGA